MPKEEPSRPDHGPLTWDREGCGKRTRRIVSPLGRTLAVVEFRGFLWEPEAEWKVQPDLDRYAAEFAAAPELRAALASCVAVLGQLQIVRAIRSSRMQTIMAQGYTGAAIVRGRAALAAAERVAPQVRP